MALSRRPVMKKNPLSKPQKRLLKESLRSLFSTEFIQEEVNADSQKEDSEKLKRMVIKNALNAIVLDN